jgi:O-antigen/teichoic acid export membrane protein
VKPFDAAGAFRQPGLNGDGQLRQAAARGAGLAVFSAGSGVGIQVIATMVLARLLTPADFGVVTMVSTFSLLFVNFGLNGFTEAVIQWEEINHALVSNLFWINLAAGLAITLGFAAAGSLLARFYGDARVARAAIGMSAAIFVTSASVLHLALLKRGMRFSVLSGNDIVARCVSVALSILLARAGWGYWALIAGAVGLPLSTLAGACWLCRWTPGLPRRAAGTGSMVRFAMNTYTRFTVGYFARNMDNLLVGWRFSAQSLGFYKRSYDLFALSATSIISPITSVALSVLSRLCRDPREYRRSVLSALSVVAFLSMGVSGILTLVGRDLIRILLGPGWEQAGRIFTFFGPGIGFMMLYYTVGWIHLSLGRADRWLRWSVPELIVTALLLAVGIQRGPEGIAAAWTVSYWILTVPSIWYAGRPVQLGIVPVIGTVWKYSLASLLAGLVTAVIAGAVPSLNAASGAAGAALRLVAASSIFGILYLAAVTLLYRGCAPLLQVSRLFQDGIARRGVVAAVAGAETPVAGA